MSNKEEIYARWLAHRRQIDVPDTFLTDVMSTVKRQTASEASNPLDTALPQWLYRPWARWGAALGLIALGLFRVLYVAGRLLSVNLVMP